MSLVQDSLIRQSLECALIPYLLKLLESRMEFADNPSMVCVVAAFWLNS